MTATHQNAPDAGVCALCARPTRLQFHHLIPRKVHRRAWFARTFGREEMHQRGLWLCRLCHRFIHAQYDEATLGRDLNTLELLRAQPAVQRHVQWAARQKVAPSRTD